MMTDNVLNDSKLVRLYKNGDDEAFRQLVKRHRDKIYSAILLIVKDSNLAEDLLQEVLVKAVKTIRSGKYNEEGKF
jgi:RNA polymerase sigma-70 factor (ECF subfamily)